MSARVLASAKQRRGALADPKALVKLFSHVNIKDGVWEIKPFPGVISGDKHNSQLPHNQQVTIKNKAQLADFFNIGERTLDALFVEFSNGVETDERKRGFADAAVSEYNNTICHQLIVQHYTRGGELPMTSQGDDTDGMGRMLYFMNGNKDPALFDIDTFKRLKNDQCFKNANGEIPYSNLSHIRCVIQFAAMECTGSPIQQSFFKFHKGDEWDMTGKKNIGGKKDQYLQQPELVRFVQSINEIDTLVLERLIYEGMTRISSGLLMGKNDVDGKGYNCLMLGAPMYACTMFEPKVKKSKTGGKVKRFFTPETISFFQRYLTDYNIKGAWFARDYSSMGATLKAAGYRAGLWQFKTAAKGDKLGDGEQLDLSKRFPDGRFLVYTLVKKNNRLKGKTDYYKRPMVEGKMTTSHITGKHTGVSDAGLHGWSLDNCAEQAGTEPSTIRDFYHGTLGVDLQKVVLGQRTFQPWNEYVIETIEPLFTRRYNELRKQGGLNMEAIKQTEAQMAIVAEVGED